MEPVATINIVCSVPLSAHGPWLTGLFQEERTTRGSGSQKGVVKRGTAPRLNCLTWPNTAIIGGESIVRNQRQPCEGEENHDALSA